MPPPGESSLNGAAHVVGSPRGPPVKTAHQLRSAKANAVRHRNPGAAAEADIALRAHRVAKAIKAATEGRPPLPPEVIAKLRELLAPANPSGKGAGHPTGNPTANPSEKG